LHYHPQLAIITGIAWDHINVFPTYPEYVETFRKFIQSVEDKIFYYHDDADLKQLAIKPHTALMIPYFPLKTEIIDQQVYIVYNHQKYPIQIFGEHNMSNLSSALNICLELGINAEEFFQHIQSFKGAAKRMELLFNDENKKLTIYKDFAHAPSKVKATVKAIRERYPERQLLLALELHTYSSLQKDFIEQYKNSLNLGDAACVYIDNEALKLKRREPIDSEWLKEQFNHPDLYIPKDATELEQWLLPKIQENTVVLMMSSGHWGGLLLNNLYN
jgi:UDP-N-acetylmuramate: L-alanyl-gamma-D-glutamyl-meso-diaminopimelate ligase